MNAFKPGDVVSVQATDIDRDTFDTVFGVVEDVVDEKRAEYSVAVDRGDRFLTCLWCEWGMTRVIDE